MWAFVFRLAEAGCEFPIRLPNSSLDPAEIMTGWPKCVPRWNFATNQAKVGVSEMPRRPIGVNNMNRFGCAIGAICCMSLCTDAIGQDAREAEVEQVQEGPPVAAIMPGLAGELMKAVERELAVLKSVAELDDKSVADLRTAIGPAVNLAATMNKDSNAIVGYMMGEIPLGVQKAIVAAARSIVNDEAALQRYADDQAVRLKFRQAATAQGFVSQVHRAVGLRSEQLPRVQKIAEELAAAGTLPSMFTPTRTLSSRVDARLATVLSDKQMAWWKKNAANARQDSAITLKRSTELEQTRKLELAARMKPLAEARIAWLTAEFALDERQTQKLELAAKGAIAKIAGERIVAEDRFQESFEQAGQIRFNTKTAKLATAGTADLFLLFSRWPKLMKSTLDSDQSAALERFDKARRAIELETTASMMVLSFGRGASLSGRQMENLRGLFLKHISPSDEQRSDPYSRYDAYGAMLKLPAADYVAAVGQDAFEAIRPLLAEMAATFSEEEEARGGQ